MIAGLTTQDMANIAAIGGLVVPFLTSLLKREEWSTGTKQAIAFGVSAAIAVWVLVIGHQISGSLAQSPGAFAAVIGEVFTASQIVYRTLFAGSNVERALRSVGSKKQEAPNA
jgi:hypothetical protein